MINVHHILGEHADASRLAAQMRAELEARTDRDPWTFAAIGLLHAVEGNRAEALRKSEEARTLIPTTNDVFGLRAVHLVLARMHVHLGDADTAIVHLDRSLALARNVTGQFLEVDPFWDPLRDLPAFQDLLVRYPGR